MFWLAFLLVGPAGIATNLAKSPCGPAVLALSPSGPNPLRTWLESELAVSEAERGGKLRRALWIDTQSPETLAIARRVLGRYGVEVLRVPTDVPYEELLALSREGLSLLSVIHERADGTLSIFTRPDVPAKTYSLPPRSNEPKSLSPIELALSQYVVDRFHSAAPKGFRFDSPTTVRPIDFGLTPYSLLEGRTPVQQVLEHSPIYSALVRSVVDDGVLFRTPINRRQGHIFISGLHAGVPLTPKSTKRAETSYLVHDLAHELVPDLFFDGTSTTPLEKRIYVAHRAVSETIAVSVADLWFPLLAERAAGEKGNPKYFPFGLPQHLALDFEGDPKGSLKRLIGASVALFLKGDDVPFRALLKPGEEGLAALAKFRAELAPIFVGDLHWNARNADEVAGRAAAEARWTKDTLPLFDSHEMKRETVGQYAKELALPSDSSWDGIVDGVFEKIFEGQLAVRLVGPRGPPVSAAQRLARASNRYMAGQLALLERHPDVPETEPTRAAILAFLKAKQSGMTTADVAHVRGLYERYVDKLYERHRINADDRLTYRDLFPHYEPNYLNFEDYAGRPLREVVDEIAPATPNVTKTSRLIEEMEAVRRGIRHTEYREEIDPLVDEQNGIYCIDCSHFARYLIDRVSPTAYAEVAKASTPRATRPLAKDFTYFFDLLGRGEVKSEQWTAVKAGWDLKPGDVVSWTTPATSPSVHTGHTVLVAAAPYRNPERPEELIVPILDSTGTGHGGEDPRRRGGPTGVGLGKIGLRLDENGVPTARWWKGGESPVAHSTMIRMGRLKYDGGP